MYDFAPNPKHGNVLMLLQGTVGKDGWSKHLKKLGGWEGAASQAPPFDFQNTLRRSISTGLN